MIAKGTPVNVHSGRPMQKTAIGGWVEVAEALIRAHSDVNSKSIFAEYMPLHNAAKYGQVEVIHTLVKAGAKIDAPCHVSDSEYWSIGQILTDVLIACFVM